MTCPRCGGVTTDDSDVTTDDGDVVTDRADVDGDVDAWCECMTYIGHAGWPEDREPCSRCGEMTDWAAMHIEPDDRLTCPACRAGTEDRRQA